MLTSLRWPQSSAGGWACLLFTLVAVTSCQGPSSTPDRVVATHGCCEVPPSRVAGDRVPCEPRPLRLVELAHGKEPRDVELRLVANDSGPFRLRVLEPATLRFVGGGSELRGELTLGSDDHLLRLRTIDGAPVLKGAVQLELLGADGNPHYVVDALLEAHPAPIEDQQQRRVAVVFDLADGERIVEYMTATEARRRNLTPVPSSATGAGR